MSLIACQTCRHPKGLYACGACQGPICKVCVQVLEKHSFPLLESIPAELEHKIYCPQCYVTKVAPALEDYRDTVERAKKMVVFVKGQGEETRHYRRHEKPITVEGAMDRQETMMKLAFKAAKLNFNAMLDVDIRSGQVRNEGYQSSRYRGVAIPTNLDVAAVEARDTYVSYIKAPIK